MKSAALPPKHVGEAIRRLRKKAGLNQEQLAQRTGINASSISRYERGKNQVGKTNLKKLCAILDCPPERLFKDAWEISEETSDGGRPISTAAFPAAELERIYDESAGEWKSLYLRTCRALFDAIRDPVASPSSGSGRKLPPKAS